MEDKKQPKKTSGGSKIVIVVLLLVLGVVLLALALIVGGVVGYYYARNTPDAYYDDFDIFIDDEKGPNWDGGDAIDSNGVPDGDVSGEDPTLPGQPDRPDNPPMQTFTGTKIKAKIPQGWDIEEGLDGAGSDMLVEGVDYEGVSAITVENENGKWLFKLYGVSGIGGLGDCETYYKFDDDNPEYYNDTKDTTQQILGLNPTIVQHSSSQYSEFYLFDRRIRRVGKSIYWDTDDGNEYFEAGCGISYSFIPFSDINLDPDMDESAYGWKINAEATDSDLKKLDDVLESLDTN